MKKYTSPFQSAYGADTDVCQLLLNADFFIKYSDLDSVEYETNYLLRKYSYFQHIEQILTSYLKKLNSF